MCRACDEGGRRCPSNRGDRRRAYQRGRYVSAASREGFDSSHTRGGVAALPDPSTTPVSEMTRQQRIEVQAAARERIITQRVVIAAAMDDIASSIRISTEMLDALSMNSSGGSILGSDEDRRKLVSANQELGRDTFLAAECEFQNRLEDLGIDDENVMTTVRDRINSHPHVRAAAARENALANEAAGAEMDGRAPLLDRLDHWRKVERGSAPDDDSNPLYPRVSAREMRTFLRAAYGSAAVDDEEIRTRVQESRERTEEFLKREVDFLQERIDAEHESRRDPNRIDTLQKRLDHVQARYEAYVRKPDTPEPRDAVEFSDIESMLNGRHAGDAGDIPRRIYNEVNRERRDVQRQAIIDELSRVQSFGGQTISPMATGGKVTKDVTQTFNEATALFPDEMVARAKERFPDLVLRQTSKRAHFSEGRYQEWSESAHQYIAAPDLSVDPSSAFDDHIAYLEESKLSSSSRTVAATDENRAKMQAIADAHNRGQTEWRVPGRRGRYSSSTPRALVVAEILGDDGEKKLVLRTKSKAASKVYGHAPELTTDGSVGTTIHELGHMMERDPRVFFACKQFLHDRTRNKDEIVYNRSRKHGVEMTVPDGFANEYIGKDYAGRAATEVFSMGMEGIFAVGRGGCRGVNEIPSITKNGVTAYDGVTDDEHRNLVLGILAGFQTSGPPMTRERAKEVIEAERKRNAAERAERAARKRETVDASQPDTRK